MSSAPTRRCRALRRYLCPNPTSPDASATSFSPVLAMHDLVRTEVVSLVVPTIEGGPPCVDTLFPAPRDKFRYAEPALRLLENRATAAMLETDVASIQLQAVVWRSKYIQMFVPFFVELCRSATDAGWAQAPLDRRRLGGRAEVLGARSRSAFVFRTLLIELSVDRPCTCRLSS